ncbi:NAD(P)-dependent oxidoreductase [Microbulbifer spongiae]|uniref:NAD(P)-dependent oxidoreductase n=1 Tax=Microbulbifer spongiae TaxID=2944933 RepID=A0ABY9EGF3_9GAMM|nr:NAD(P)-dependent oxidoreductase [Microbulbifer sp. MI-G]WKD51392.1 NAD(P)-dependent oxidoreductase [Microbulbifer sp. MI-G]
MATVAFIGLGVMGYPMAGYLSRAGHCVRVYNRTLSRKDQWLRAYTGWGFATPGEAARGAEVVFTCVGNDHDLSEVVRGEQGALAAMGRGTLLVDHTTVSADITRSLAVCARDREIGYLDAPVSGGQAGAQKGSLTVMVGGQEADYQRALPLINCYADAVKLMGPVGSGQLCKMVNQICIAGVVQGLAEGLHFAKAAGLDAEEVVSVISKGAAQSWQMENRSKTMLAGEYEHGFAVDWMRKDLAIVLDEARRNGALLPLTALVDQFYSEVQAIGGSRWDTSSLFARLMKIRPFE